MTESAHDAFARDHLVVMCAPNGARRTKADHPALPLTPAELADEAEALVAAGVSVLHLHVRDDQGRHSLSVDAYRAAIEAIRRRVGDALVLQATSEAVDRYRPDEQMAMVRALQPDAVSLALRELIPDSSAAAPALAFFRGLRAAGTWPQFIVYTPDELRWLDDLRRGGHLGDGTPACLLVLGRYAAERRGSLAELNAFEATGLLPRFAWWACCFGADEGRVLAEVARRGGHVRLGFENNLELADGVTAAGNAQLIEAFLAKGPYAGRRAATAATVREFLFPECKKNELSNI